MLKSSGIYSILGLALWVGCASAPENSKSAAKARYGKDCIAVANVFYATDRRKTDLGFSNQEDPDLKATGYHTGLTRVVLPGCRREGIVREKAWFRIFDTPRQVELHLARAKQWIKMSPRQSERWLKRDRRRDAVVFIHGYNTSFKVAAETAVGLAQDLEMQGPVYLYSWASVATEAGYIEDTDRVRRTAPRLAAFLRKILKHSGAERVHFVGHSMGTRALVEATTGLKKSSLIKKLGHFVLLAPDIDARRFETQSLPALRSLEKELTLYVSDKDAALKISEAVRVKARRLGRAGEDLSIFEGMTTIDTTRCNEDCLLCHDLMALPCVSRDLQRLLKGGERLAKRNLNKKQRDKKYYFELRK